MTLFPETRSTLLAALRSPGDRCAWDEFVLIYRPVFYRMNTLIVPAYPNRRSHMVCPLFVDWKLLHLPTDAYLRDYLGNAFTVRGILNDLPTSVRVAQRVYSTTAQVGGLTWAANSMVPLEDRWQDAIDRLLATAG